MKLCMTTACKYWVIGLVWLGIAITAQAAPILYSYDSLSRLTHVAYPDGTTITYTYDAAGNILNRKVELISPPPTLTGITPISAGQGLTVNVTLNGTNLVSPMTIAAGAGIAVSNVSVVSSSIVTASFTISLAATLGGRNVTVTTPDGTSNAVTFSVITLPLPTLAGIGPSSGGQGSTVNVTLSGTNLISGMTVSAGSEITVSDVTVAESTSATAKFTISASAMLGPHDVTVTTSGGTSSRSLHSHSDTISETKRPGD